MTVSGELNQRIRVDMRVKSTDTRGAVIVSFVPWSQVVGGLLWAKVNPKRTREFFAAQQVQTEISTTFRVRYRQGIDPTMRIFWDGEFYQICAPAVRVDGGREWMDLFCKTGVADGR